MRRALKTLGLVALLLPAAAPGVGRAAEAYSFTDFSDPAPVIDEVDVAPESSDAEVVECDEKKCQELSKNVASAYKGVFYENDFGYLCDPCYCGWYPGDHLKRLCVHDGIVLDIGGQYRMRCQDEHNIRGLGLTGLSDDFLLHRTRLYANLEIGHRFRAYVEYIDAVSFYEDNPPRPIDENRSDLLNAFGEVLLWEDGCCCSELRTRIGRQELLYGAQRAVSPLDWANTRRTFQGYKGMYQGHGWNVDGFWTNPLDPDTYSFDDPNDEEFMGVYATTSNCNDRTVDLFYLRLLDEQDQGPFPNDFDFHTIGGRVKGKHGCYDYEVWGAYQFGENTDGSDHVAGAFTLGVGRTLECHCWKPSLWVYYDWASGTDDQGAGNGYHHLFPLAHKYLGFMDLYGRRNIETPNVLLTVQPHEKLKLLLWYYYFRLQNGNDTPYSVVMTPFFPGVTPTSRDLGHEIDLTAAYQLNARMQILFGYSHFFSGRYYNNPALPTDADADFFYAQFEFNF